jgi:hypothetical protein
VADKGKEADQAQPSPEQPAEGTPGKVISIRKERWDATVALVNEASATDSFAKNYPAQVKLLYNTADILESLSPEKREWLTKACCALVPRLTNAPLPEITFDEAMYLYRMENPVEQFNSFVQSKFLSLDYKPHFGEGIYNRVDGWLGQFIRWCSKSETPTGFNFWAGVWAMGAACRYNFFIPRGSYALRMNSYAILVAKKGVGKSSASNAAKDILRRMNFYIEPDLDATFQLNPRQVRFLPEATNLTTVAKRLQTYQWLDPETDESYRVPSVGALAVDELGTLLDRQGFQVDKLITFLNMVEGGTKFWEYETQAQGSIILRDIALSFIGCIPVDTLHTLSPNIFGGGFTDRTMWVYREDFDEDFPNPEFLDPVLANQLAKWLVPLATRRMPEALMMTPEAEQWHDEWYLKQPGKVDDPVLQSRKRRSNHVYRLAGILCLNEECIPYIQLRHLQLAVELLDREVMFYDKFRGLVDQAPEVDLENHILKVIQRHPKITRGQLFNLLRQKKGLNPPSVRATPYLDTLLEVGLVETERSGRTTLWSVTKKGKRNV